MNKPKEFYQQIPLTFLSNLKLTPAESLVLSKIRSLESKKFGETCISRYDTIGQYLGMSEIAVSYAAKKLQKKGLLQVGEYSTPNARRSYLKTYYKKTTPPVDSAVVSNGTQSVYVKIPKEIVESTMINASNKLYYAVISHIRSKYDIDSQEPISFKHISFYLPLAKRKTVSDNIKKLQDLNIIDDLGYSIFSNEILKQEKSNAPRGKTKQSTLSPEEKDFLNNIDNDFYDNALEAIINSKTYNRATKKRHRNVSKHILDLPFLLEEEKELEIVNISRVGEQYDKAMQGINRTCNLDATNFEYNKAIFEKNSWDKIRKIDIQKKFINAHTSSINFACDHGYINQFPDEYFKDIYQHFPRVLENITSNKKTIQDILARIGIIDSPTLSWNEEIEQEFNTPFFKDILKEVLIKYEEERGNSPPISNYELSIIDIMSTNSIYYINLQNPTTFEKPVLNKLNSIINRFIQTDRSQQIPKQFLTNHCEDMNESPSQNCTELIYKT